MLSPCTLPGSHPCRPTLELELFSCSLPAYSRGLVAADHLSLRYGLAIGILGLGPGSLIGCPEPCQLGQARQLSY